MNFSSQASQLVQIVITKGVEGYEKLHKTKTSFDQDLPKGFRLVYHFYESEYLGGAHGLAGILNILLLSYQLYSKSGFTKELNRVIKLATFKSVEFLLSQLVENNFDAAVESKPKASKFTQFCHGNPGILTPLLHFCELFPEAAKELNLQKIIVSNMNKIWEEGILKKGYWGLCHGTSGNAYTFISSVFHRVLGIHAE